MARKRVGAAAASTNDLTTTGEVTAGLLNYLAAVVHNDVASTTRPTTNSRVLWVGSVTPTNALTTDIYLQVAATSSFTGALDSMSAPYRAHSVRRLRSAYTGPLLRVRRSTDSTEQDIGYTTAGDLDTSALSTFVGSGSGYITTWYDQSGNARHLTQATAAAQPRIVNAGTTDTVGTKTGIVLDGTDDYIFDTAPGLYAAGSASIAAVVLGASASQAPVISEPNAATAGSFYRPMRTSTANWNVQATNDAGTSLYATSTGGTNLFDGSIHQTFYYDSGSLINTWKDAAAAHVNITATRNGALTPTRTVFGASVQSGGVTAFFGGRYGEVIAWGSDQTANRTSLSTNQKAYFGTP